MPSSGHTDYLGLPQWLVTDHPQMPDDLNRSFAAIDTYAAGRRLQTYTALDQLGLSGLVTTAQVCAAMPPCSKLVLRNILADANRIADAPYDWVMVTITRPGISSDCKCAAESLDGTDRWEGIYSQESVPAFGGWAKTIGITAMISNSSMDNYTAPGDYQCPANEVAGTITNIPSPSAGLLEVRDLGGTIFQRYTVFTGNTIYMRYKPNWGDCAWDYWRRVCRDDDIGSWTPYLYSDGGTAGGYSKQYGMYIKLGNLVIAWATLQLSSKGNLSGGVSIRGLPYPRAASTQGYYAGFAGYNNLSGVGPISLELSGAGSGPDSANISWLYYYNNGSVASVQGSHFGDATAIEGATWIYLTN